MVCAKKYILIDIIMFEDLQINSWGYLEMSKYYNLVIVEVMPADVWIDIVHFKIHSL